MGKATEAENTAQQKTFSADTVSVLLMAVGVPSISSSQYEMMSALDGTRTASSFQHQFRSVLAKAREFRDRVEQGEKFEAVTPSSKKRTAPNSANVTPASTPKKPRTSAKPRAKPSPKPSPKPKKGAKSAIAVQEEPDDDKNKEPQEDSDSPGDAFAEGLKEMVKQEQQWEI